MKALILVITILSAVVRGQVISPCFNDCLILWCPKGVNDYNCFCVDKNSNINACANHSCDPAAIGDGQMVQQKYCKITALLEWC